MAIAPLGGNSRYISAQRDKNEEAQNTAGDSENTLRGQGIIDNTSEYASMAMLASQFNRRKELRSSSDDNTIFTERILDDNADEKVSHIEKIINREEMTPPKLRSFLAQLFPDTSDMLMVIFELLRRKKLTSKIVSNLNTLKSVLTEEDTERRTEAGVNVALSARLFSHSLDKTSIQLRDIYRDFICYDGPIIYIYEQWVSEITSQQREIMLRYLTRSLACDLQSIPTGNINVVEFGDLFRRVGGLREIQSVEIHFLQKIMSTELISISNDQELSNLFVSGIRNIDNYKISLAKFYSEKLSLVTYETKAIFLQLLLSGFSSVSVDIFFSLEKRDKLIHLMKEKISQIKLKEDAVKRINKVKSRDENA
ncbi:hypothetical protein PL78_14545 [Yersinia entomophaga]|uniref:Hypersensitivity response secretion-like HrpJ domain-containing protein n=1 Tax=Yersinia entomophaga TaxID=935293 RepID=A0ABM6BNX2_YERET|nr:type III secretion system gatekeeper subunit SctW [Yersinia entomophaga]ANI31039.1 hypothetical protein PL78_14545 [Yersinia entomophaga]OWF88683.1 hypothetical protein B4914_06965 [Yersinia entomophaga]